MTAPAKPDDTSADENTPEGLAALLEQILTAAEAITAAAEAAGRELTAEEDRQHTELTTRATRVGGQLERAQQLRTIRSAAGGGDGRYRIENGTPGGTRSDDAGWSHDPFSDPRDTDTRTRGRDPWSGGVIEWGRSATQVTSEYRARALAAIERMPAATDKVRKAATDMIERWDDDQARLSRLALALSEPAYLRAFAALARNPYGAGELDDPERRAIARVRDLGRALSLTDTGGGYLVPFQLDPTVIITANGSVNQIRQAARTVIATGDVWHGVSAGAVEWSWAAEGQEATDDSPTFGQPGIPVHRAQGFVPISFEAFQDAPNITAEVSKLLAFGKDVLEAEAFTTGSGTGEPTGIVTALAGGPAQVNATTAGSLDVGDLYRLDSGLPGRYRMNASWLGSRTIYNRIRAFGTNGGSDLWERIGADMPPLLLGAPARESENMTATLDSTVGNNPVLIYGDFEHFVIVDRVGLQVELIPTLFGPNRRPTGQRGWHAWYRTGSDSTNDSAFRMLAA